MTKQVQLESARDVIRWIRLVFFQNDIRKMRAHGLNVGYPVLALVFSQIDYLADLMYFEESDENSSDGQENTRRQNSNTVLAGKFMSREMGRVNPIYDVKFKEEYKFERGKAEDFAQLLYLGLRSKLVHAGGCYPPFEVTAEEGAEHLHMKLNPATGLFMVHAYRMNDELQGSIQMLYARVLHDWELFEKLTNRISREKTRILKHAERATEIVLEMIEKGFLEEPRTKR